MDLVAKHQNQSIALSKMQHSNCRKLIDLKLSTSKTDANIQ
jgi:hypothetical protein